MTNLTNRIFFASTEHELFELACAHRNNYFTHYYMKNEDKSNEFLEVLQYFNLDIKGKVVLDIGPGTGDSLLLAKQLGAKRLLAVDTDPWFLKLQLLRGHQSYYLNYMNKRFKSDYFPLECKGVDFIWCKGALNCSRVNSSSGWGLNSVGLKTKNFIRGFEFAKWIDSLKSLLNPGGSIFFVPAVDRMPDKIIDHSYPIETYHWIADSQSWENSFFSKILIKQGFDVYNDIHKVNHPKAFPCAYFYPKHSVLK